MHCLVLIPLYHSNNNKWIVKRAVGEVYIWHPELPIRNNPLAKPQSHSHHKSRACGAVTSVLWVASPQSVYPGSTTLGPQTPACGFPPNEEQLVPPLQKATAQGCSEGGGG